MDVTNKLTDIISQIISWYKLAEIHSSNISFIKLTWITPSERLCLFFPPLFTWNNLGILSISWLSFWVCFPLLLPSPPHFLFLNEFWIYIHRHANKLKGQFSIPSALQQTICCSLNDSCLAQKQVWLPLCNTRVLLAQQQKSPARHCPARSQSAHALAQHLAPREQGYRSLRRERAVVTEEFPWTGNISRCRLLFIARTRGPALKTCFCGKIRIA